MLPPGQQATFVLMIKTEIDSLRERLRAHGGYRVLAERSQAENPSGAVSRHWLAAFARGKFDNPGVLTLGELERLLTTEEMQNE